MEMTMDGDYLEDDFMVCPTCHLVMYPTNDMKKFFLFTCRVCNYEDQLDYEFTWEEHKVNKKSIIAPTRRQEENQGTCCPCAVLTSTETRLNFNRALENEDAAELLSLDHLIDQYSEEEERKTGSRYDGSKGYKLKETAYVMSEKGVATDSDYASKTHTGKALCRAKRYQKRKTPFTEICQKILKGNAVFTSIPVTKKWKKLKDGELYIADRSAAMLTLFEDVEEWHAIVLIGFGRNNGVNYFRFQNSSGLPFGMVRAQEICDISCFEPYYGTG